MNAHDIPAELLAEAEAIARRPAVLDLLHREFGAILKIDAILRKAIEQEEAAGIDVCAPQFLQILWLLNASIAAVMGELGRGA